MQTITEEINQSKPFELIEIEVYLNLMRTTSALREKLDEVMCVYGIDHFQYNILRILRGSEKILPVSEIEARMVLKPDSVEKLLEILAERGLIDIKLMTAETKIQDFVEITNQGLDIVNILDEPVKKQLQRQIGFLGKEMLEQFNALLVMARKNTNDKF